MPMISPPVYLVLAGQKAKILLTYLVMSEPELLILDEPTRNLSPLTLPVIESMIRDYHGAVLAVSHDRTFLRHVMTKVVQFDASGLHVIDFPE